MNDDIPELAAMFRALGDPTRLKIFNFLRQCGRPVAVAESGDVRPVEGVTVGDVCCQVMGSGTITSTLSHHIKELRLAGLITVERSGKHMICRIAPNAVPRLTDALTAVNPETDADCCPADTGDTS